MNLTAEQEAWYARMKEQGKAVNERPIRKRRDETPRGYAAPPGTGPEGEKCGTCVHSYRRGGCAGGYYKCRLVKPTRSTRTDIRLKSPACSRWERKAEGGQP